MKLDLVFHLVKYNNLDILKIKFLNLKLINKIYQISKFIRLIMIIFISLVFYFSKPLTLLLQLFINDSYPIW